jgi:hypothetical protein
MLSGGRLRVSRCEGWVRRSRSRSRRLSIWLRRLLLLRLLSLGWSSRSSGRHRVLQSPLVQRVIGVAVEEYAWSSVWLGCFGRIALLGRGLCPLRLV